MTRFSILLCLLLSLLLFPSCSEEELDTSQAKLRMLHAIPDVGTLELLLDGKRLMKLDANELGSTEGFSTGPHILGVRLTGAPQPFKELSYNFSNRVYFAALSGSFANSTVQLHFYDQAPPSNLGKQAAIEVVSLYEGGAQFDVYLGDTLIAGSLGFRAESAFETVSAGGHVLSIFNTGDDPGRDVPLLSQSLSLESGRAYMLLLQLGSGRSVLAEHFSIK
ncbi:MAG: hypothetical protein RBU37_07920 [Myxococcota bacterium]|nr:hypothetical protein [Myxococcota bacterium]